MYEADFHKPGIYGRGQVWANAWDVFRRKPSRGARGRLAAVDFLVCFGSGGISFFFRFSLNAHGLLQVSGRPTRPTEAFFCLLGKKASSQ